MKVKFEYEGYWDLQSFESNLKCFENSARDCGVWISGPIKLVPYDDPGKGYKRLTLVLIPCEFKFESIHELTSMVVELHGVGPSDFTLNGQMDENGSVFLEMKIL